MRRTREDRWERIAQRHAAAVQRFLEAGTALSPAQWRAPIGAGKWKPGQITQHLIQTYEVMTRQLRTGQALRVQTKWWHRQVLRIMVLRPIMWTRRLPSGAKAARELLPNAVEIGQAEALGRLADVVAEFESELAARREDHSLQLTHHYFGSVDAISGLDFIAVHTAHHGRQLSKQLRSSPKRG